MIPYKSLLQTEVLAGGNPLEREEEMKGKAVHNIQS